MPSAPTMTPEQLLLESLPFIEKAVGFLARRYHLLPQEEEEFLSRVMVKLVDKDYEVFRSFRGECKLESYLTTVLSRYMQDYANHLWGKWRPSAEAKRLGETAQRLERLLHLKGCTLDEAYEHLKRHYGIQESREQIDDLAAKLPPRVSWKFEGEEELQNLPSASQADELLWGHERHTRKRKILNLLERVRRKLHPEDWFIVRSKAEGVSLHDIAKSLKIDPTQIYRRRDKALKTLREALEAEGVRAEDIAETFGRDDEL